MTYDLEEGNLYLVKESDPVLSLEAFRDLVKAGYRGAILSRTPPREFDFDFGQPVEFRWLSENGDDGSLAPRLADIERWVTGMPRSRALLIDRLDYLVSKNGSKSSLYFIHRLRELAYLMGHIVVISVDPTTLGVRNLRAFEKESREVVARALPGLPGGELEVLRFVFDQSITGSRPTLTGIGAGLGLSKPTVRKNVRDLVRRGYLSMSPRGRTKVLELTDQGRRILQK